MLNMGLGPVIKMQRLHLIFLMGNQFGNKSLHCNYICVVFAMFSEPLCSTPFVLDAAFKDSPSRKHPALLATRTLLGAAVPLRSRKEKVTF